MKKRILDLLLVCALLFSMVPAFAAETKTASGTIFTDVSSGSWYAKYVLAANKYGLMNGTGSNQFEPEGTSTRAQFVQSLYAMAGKPEVAYDSRFADVPKNEWYASAVSWAVANGITSGTDANHFSPDDQVTRQQIALFLYAYEGKPAVTGSLSGYPDEGTVASWAYDALVWATQNGIMSGSSENGAVLLLPENTATRCVVATMLVGYFNYKENQCTEGINDISGITADRASGKVTVSVNTVKSGVLTVELLADDNETVIDTQSVNVTRQLAGDGITVTFPASEIPAYFYLRASLSDFDGNQTCTPFTCQQYSSAYRDFMDRTVDDYDEAQVLNFDEDTEDNFAVVYDDVQLVCDGDSAGNEIDSIDELTFTVSGPAFNDVAEGDRYVLIDSDGTAHMVTVSAVVDYGSGTYNITSADEGNITAFFTYFQFRYEGSSVSEAAPVTYSGFTEDLGTAKIDKKLSVGDTYVDISAEVGGTETWEFDWEFNIFNLENSFLYVKMEDAIDYTATFTIGVAGEGKAEFPVPGMSIGTGKLADDLIDATVGTVFVISVEASAEATAEFEGSRTMGFTLDGSGVHTINVDNGNNVGLTAKGEIKAEAALEFKAGADLGETLSAEVGIGSGIVIDSVLPITATVVEGAEKVHGCESCVEGKFYGQVRVFANASYKICNPFTGNTLTLWGNELEDEWGTEATCKSEEVGFYVSLLNDADSLYGGALTFGIGACENSKYRTTLKAVDENGSLYSTNVKVSGTNIEGFAASKSAASGSYVYLYPGSYTASAAIDGEDCSTAFTKAGSVSTVTVKPQLVSLYVSVVDESGSPIDSAAVNVTSGTVVSKGTVEHNGTTCAWYKVAPGTVEIEASADKYSTAKTTVTMTGSRSVTLTLKNTDWVAAYAAKIRSTNNSYYSFALCYVDEDDIPELVISEGPSHVCESELFTYYNGEVVELGYCSDFGEFYYIPGENRVLCHVYVNSYGPIITSDHITDGELIQDIRLDAYYEDSDYTTMHYKADGKSITESAYNSYKEAYGVNDEVSAAFTGKCTSAYADQLVQDYTQFLDKNG